MKSIWYRNCKITSLSGSDIYLDDVVYGHETIRTIIDAHQRTPAVIAEKVLSILILLAGLAGTIGVIWMVTR